MDSPTASPLPGHPSKLQVPQAPYPCKSFKYRGMAYVGICAVPASIQCEPFLNYCTLLDDLPQGTYIQCHWTKDKRQKGEVARKKLRMDGRRCNSLTNYPWRTPLPWSCQRQSLAESLAEDNGDGTKIGYAGMYPCPCVLPSLLSLSSSQILTSFHLSSFPSLPNALPWCCGGIAHSAWETCRCLYPPSRPLACLL